MKAHMDWSNGVQDKGGQTCGRHPHAGRSDNIIRRGTILHEQCRHQQTSLIVQVYMMFPDIMLTVLAV